MSASIAAQPSPRPKATGRPSGDVHPLLAAGEAIAESLAAVVEDHEAFAEGVRHLKIARSVVNRIEDLLTARARRIAGVIVPELQRLSARTERSIAERHR